MLRSPQLQLFGGFSMNAAVGEGVSYAHSLPKFEGSIAAEGPGAAGPRQFLNYLAYEVELTHERLSNWHLVLNVHHRSGIWGGNRTAKDRCQLHWRRHQVRFLKEP